MDENIKKLKLQFIRISNMGWIKGQGKGYKNIGYTFERLLNKEVENLEMPDYEGIEIKTKRVFNKSYITLFSANPDGSYLFEIERIRNTYGYPDSVLRNFKVFNISVFSNNFKRISNTYFLKLNVDKINRKIYLCVFNKKYKLIDNQTFWTFNLLEEKLNRKLKTLAVIDALHKKNKDGEYFKYNNISFYKLRDFDKFVNLIETGIIRISFKISIFRDGKRLGEIHNHGTGFDIKEEELTKLYEIIKI